MSATATTPQESTALAASARIVEARHDMRAARLQGCEGLAARQRFENARDDYRAAWPWIAPELVEGYSLGRTKNVATGHYSLGLFKAAAICGPWEDGYVGHFGGDEASWEEGDHLAMLRAYRLTVEALPESVLA